MIRQASLGKRLYNSNCWYHEVSLIGICLRPEAEADVMKGLKTSIWCYNANQIRPGNKVHVMPDKSFAAWLSKDLAFEMGDWQLQWCWLKWGALVLRFLGILCSAYWILENHIPILHYSLIAILCISVTIFLAHWHWDKWLEGYLNILYPCILVWVELWFLYACCSSLNMHIFMKLAFMFPFFSPYSSQLPVLKMLESHIKSTY